jgi:hypothetical protein
MREAKALILDYSKRFGDPEGYVGYYLSKLLEQCKSIEDLRAWDREAKALILDYSKRFGDPGSYVVRYLPKLLEQCKTIDEVREAKALILDYSKRFGDPWRYVKDSLPKLLEQCGTIEELRKISNIAKELIKASVNPSPLADILEITTERSIIYESHRDKFIRFCKNSGPNLANNLEFFKELTSGNADELFDESVKYFQAMKISLFLPLLFEEFRVRDAEGKERLAEDFRNYYSSQVKGKTVTTTELSEEIIEEINYSLVGSASLTRERYIRTLEKAKGKTIPEPNFSKVVRLELQKSQKKGSIPEKDIKFLKDRIGWIEEAVQLGDQIDDVEKAIADFPPTDRPGRKPTKEHTKKLMMLHLLKSYRSNPDLKTKIDELIEKRVSISSTDLGVPERLIEIFKEIKPEVEADIRRRIDGAVDVPRLEKIIGRFKKQRSENIVTIELIPAKTEIDCFYGYMGENCTSKYPEELLNPAFTPMRIVVNGKIVGSIHTLTLMIKGKKILVLPGIEPKESLLAEVDAEEFTHALIEKVIEEICRPNGYTQLCLSTKEASQSNRPPVVKAVQKIIEGKDRIKQTIQSTFPQKSVYSIEELAVVWEANFTTQ